MGERATVCAFLQAADVGSCSSAAAAALAQWPQDLSVSGSGLWCQALCVSLHVQTHTYTHTHIPLTRYRGADTLTSLALH